ncbi:class I adenylate-forming enzyme family protein [Lysinibacillus sp. Bpr_S20]|uniref:class I adenylate-forming enzyme family protein n=1 Tax=Lysinibacillus sp. Bpr_S20 TaxID=2933964 RepID=UPI0020120A63|nr:class I adenylate-forming enzyme family protein [Lysinibacillus sp. Bpr_S20]MCL1699468.1 acyl--CoA ligase [Lysinibacillus sp. Bpr_S20]
MSNCTIYEAIYKANEKMLDKEVCFDGSNRKTYAELFEDVERLAGALQAMGVQKGDHIAVSLPNWYEFYIVFLAIVKSGATIVPFNTAYKIDEIHYILQNSRAKAFFTTAENARKLESVKQSFQTLEHIVLVRETDQEKLTLEKLLHQELSFIKPNIEPSEDDVAIILYTSGTTGAPKGAMLTHSNVLYNAVAMKNALRVTSLDVVLIPVPLFHVFGIVAGSLVTLIASARIVLMEKYNAQEALHLIETELVTIHHGVPTMFILELNHPNFVNYNLTSLRTGIIAAAPCPVEIIQQILYKMHCNILVAYGLSETSPAVTVSDWEDSDIQRSETVGLVIKGTELRIVDDKRNELPRNNVGEIAVKGPGVMKGYFNDLQRTKEVLTEDGWFYTGDLATLDEEGYVRIIGRKKEMIIRGGYNIYPREIEEIFYQHPAVLEVAVVGLPDTVLGEVVCAAILVKDKATVQEEELLNFVQENVATYKCPTKIVILDEFPVTASGKIQKVELQKKLRKQLQTELR